MRIFPQFYKFPIGNFFSNFIKVFPVQKIHHLAIDEEDLQWYINLNSNSNQYGSLWLNRGCKRCPRGQCKSLTLIMSRKFTPRVSLRKQRPSLSQVVGMVY